MPGRSAVLRPGDWVRFDDGEHQVVGLAGTSVRLRSHDGAEQVVLGTHLMAASGFAVIEGSALPEMEPFGLLDSLPDQTLAAAQERALGGALRPVRPDTGIRAHP